jgi:hypothetical protein
MKYQITVRGALDESWRNWLGHVEVISQNIEGSPATTLHVDVPDQPALLGLLNRLANMNLVLISVQQGSETNGK